MFDVWNKTKNTRRLQEFLSRNSDFRALCVILFVYTVGFKLSI